MRYLLSVSPLTLIETLNEGQSPNQHSFDAACFTGALHLFPCCSFPVWAAVRHDRNPTRLKLCGSIARQRFDHESPSIHVVQLAHNPGCVCHALSVASIVRYLDSIDFGMHVVAAALLYSPGLCTLPSQKFLLLSHCFYQPLCITWMYPITYQLASLRSENLVGQHSILTVSSWSGLNSWSTADVA